MDLVWCHQQSSIKQWQSSSTTSSTTTTASLRCHVQYTYVDASCWWWWLLMRRRRMTRFIRRTTSIYLVLLVVLLSSSSNNKNNRQNLVLLVSSMSLKTTTATRATTTTSTTSTSTSKSIYCSSRRHVLVQTTTRTTPFVTAMLLMANGGSIGLLSTTAFSSTSFTLLLGAPQVSYAASSTSLLEKDNNNNIILKGLKEPTIDQPQIPLPNKNKDNMLATKGNNKKNDQDIVEGLLYYKNDNNRINPMTTDITNTIVVITILNSNHIVLAAAQIPFSQIINRIPFRFQMTSANIIHPQQQQQQRLSDWEYAIQNEDLILQAIICPNGVITQQSSLRNADNVHPGPPICMNNNMLSPNTVETPKQLSARGISKLLRIPASRQEGSSSSSTADDTIIRIPASLALE